MNAIDATSPSAVPAAAAKARRWLRDDRYGLVLTAMVWTLIVLMIVPDGLQYEGLSTAVSPASGSPLSRALWLALLGAGVVVIAWRIELALLLARRLNMFLFLFVALALASVAWSIEPGLTLRRCVRAVTIVAVCVAFSLACWHGRRYQNVVRPVLTAVLLGSIAFGLMAPSLAIHQESSAELVGAWRGLANHKNTLGALACMGLIFWCHAWLSREVRPVMALAGVAIAGSALVLSRSSTSLGAAVAAILLLIYLLRAPASWRRYMPPFVGALVVGLAFTTLAILHLIPGLGVLLSPVSVLTGKDLSFSGRTGIWAIIFDHIRLHPWFGTGYGAYWSGPGAASPSHEFVLRESFYPGSAHNGYLEIVNDLGFAGLFCLIGYIVVHVRQSLRLLVPEPAQGALYLALFLQQALTNLSETHWLNVLSVDFAIMTLASAALARGLIDRQLRARFGAPRVLT